MPAPALLATWRKGLATMESFRRTYEFPTPAVASADFVRTRATQSEALIGVVGRPFVVYVKLDASAGWSDLSGSAVTRRLLVAFHHFDTRRT